MSDNWIVQNLQNALDTWNEKLNEIFIILTQSPIEFKGGEIWNIMVNINGTLKAIGLALLVLFFVSGVVKTCGSFAEIKRYLLCFSVFHWLNQKSPSPLVIKNNSYRLDTFDINWKEILTYYAVTSSNREITSSLLNMNEKEYKRLEKVFWNIVDIDYKTEKYTKTITKTDKDGNVTKKKVSRKRFIVKVITKTKEEVDDKYDFSENELKQIDELLSGDYDELWENLIEE